MEKVRVYLNRKKITLLVALAMSLYHIYTGFRGLPPFVLHRGTHLAFAVTLVVLTIPLSEKILGGKLKSNRWGILLTDILDALIIVAMWWSVRTASIEYEMRVFRAGIASPEAIIAGALLLFIVLETGRRKIGMVLPAIAMISLLYARYGPYMPGLMRHRGYSWNRIFEFLAVNSDGIFGIPVGVSATFIFMFVLFGAFLEASGATPFINKFATSLTGTYRAGPSLAAVLASAFMGTVNGSAVANVAGTGSFTIPLMKDRGYSANFSGAVEAVASTGGQILPPVMGAGAFVMVVFTETPYVEIIKAAAIPAVFYFISVAIALHFRAVRRDLVGVPRSELPALRPLLKQGIVYLPPVLMLLYSLIVLRITPMTAAFYATLMIPVSTLFHHKTRFNWNRLIEGLETAAHNSLVIAIGCGTAGIVVAMVALTGLGATFSESMIRASGGNLFLALLFIAISCIILGMGLPTTAAYVITAALAAPALVRLGVPILGAHLFVFYYACLSAITPPVALAAYAGAGIAQGDAMKTAWEAVKLGIVGFVVPFMFVYGPELTLTGSVPAILLAVFTGLVGVVSISAGVQGVLLSTLGPIPRLLLFCSGLAMVYPGISTDAVGVIVLTVMFLWEKKRQGTVAPGF